MKTCATTIAVVAVAAVLSACAYQVLKRERTAPVIERLSEKLKLRGPSFQSSIPPELQTIFTRTPLSDDPKKPTLIIDSSGNRAFFPIPQHRRSFDSEGALRSFIAETFGGRPIEKKTKKEAEKRNKKDELALRGSYVWRGSGAYFVDPQTDTKYRVTDPILAYLAGVYGKIELGGKEVCLDPDGKCDEETEKYASYLAPVGEPTAPTRTRHCGRPYGGIAVCVMHHSFFNKTWFPFPYARHGANVGFTYFAPLSSTRLFAGGQIYSPAPGPNFAFLPSVSNQAQGSIETAVWSWGCTGCAAQQAEAVCAVTSVRDRDVCGDRLTGNGPLNSSICDSLRLERLSITC